ncbi:substrate-binding periplasmic protein [Thermodesulfobacteriota bacterium]
MRANKTFIIFWMIVFFIIASPLWGSEKIARLSTLVGYPPFCFQKDSKKSVNNEVIKPGSDSTVLQGYSWDIVRTSFHNRGYRIHLTVAPWSRSVYLMENQNVELLFTTAYTKERAEKYYYSREEIHKINLVIYVPLDSSIEWKGLESMHGKSVAIIRGFSGGSLWDEDTRIRKKLINRIEQALGMLDEKRIDGYATNDIVFDYYLKQHGITDKYKKLPPFDSVTEYLAGMKTNPHVKNLLDVFDTGKREIKRNGTMDKINTKWGLQRK